MRKKKNSNYKMTVDQFNKLFPIGTDIIYTNDFGVEVHTKIRSEAWELGHGDIVVQIDGRPGGFDISRIKLLDTDLDDAAAGHPKAEHELHLMREHIKGLESELETLRAENAKLIAESDELRQKHLDLLSDVLDAKALMLHAGVTQNKFSMMFKSFADQYQAEREAMMNQEPYAYVHIDADGDDAFYEEIQKTEPNCEPIKHLSWSDDLTDSFSQEFIDFKAENGKPLSVMPLYAGPLPAQQINPFPVLSSDESVPMPANADQAVAMTILGESWLKRHAPERLKSQQIPEGWKLVREEPTDDQINSVARAYPGHNVSQYARGIYQVMLSASQPRSKP